MPPEWHTNGRHRCDTAGRQGAVLAVVRRRQIQHLAGIRLALIEIRHRHGEKGTNEEVTAMETETLSTKPRCPKKRLTAAMAAAERLTIRITAMDSLNSCWRLGQTTSFSSSKVACQKTTGFGGMFSGRMKAAEVVVSSEMGLVTGMTDHKLV